MCFYSKVSLILKPRDMNFLGRTVNSGPVFFLFVLHASKNYSLYLQCFPLCFFVKCKKMKGKVFDACKVKDDEI